MNIPVLYEDNHLLVIDKPPGISTMGAKPGSISVHTWAREYLVRKYNKPGNAFVGIVSRLDRDVSGLLVLARTSKAASRLSDQIRRRTVRKRYLACIETIPKLLDKRGWTTFHDWLRKNERMRKMEVVDQSDIGAQEAILRVRALAVDSPKAIIEVDLISGRKHQIRVQLAAHSMPIVGDWKYGRGRPPRRPSGGGAIRLHCHCLQIEHPTRKTPLTFRSLPTAYWPEFSSDSWRRLESSIDGFESLDQRL